MKQKIGAYLHEDVLDIVSADGEGSLSLKNASTFQLGVANFYESLSIDNEKSLEKARQSIQKSLSTQKLNEQEANVIIPDQQCSLQIIKLPLVSEKEIISAIELQSEEFVPYPIEKASFDYQVLSVDKENSLMYLLLVVALKENINKVSDFILNLGLYPTGLETESTALFRLLLDKHLTISGDLAMVVNINSISSQVSILNLQQKQLVTTNSVNIGNLFFLKSLQNNLNVALPQAAEIFTSLKSENPHYQKIIKPVFAEYAKQMQKILMVAMDKIGTMPSTIYLHNSSYSQVYSLMFKDHPMLQQYQVVDLRQQPFAKTAISLAPEVKANAGDYLIPIGALY
jgi:Tfp pilus assembly PilM family ATPase